MGVRIFRSTDASAPVLTNALGSLVALLDAVLVNGYGAIAPLGWNIEQTATNKRGYRAAIGNRHCLGVDDSISASYAVIRGFRSMTSAGAADANGVNPFPTTAQAANNYIAKTANVPWIIYADEKRFYLFVGPTNAYCSYFFGEFESYLPNDTGNTAIIAGNVAQGYNSSGQSMLGLTCNVTELVTNHYIIEKYDGLTNSVGFGKRAVDGSFGNSSFAGASNSIYPDPATSGILQTPVKIHELVSGLMVTRGRLPGLWFPLQRTADLAVVSGDTVQGTPGTVLEGRTFEFVQIAGTGLIMMEISNTWNLVHFR